MHHVIPGYFEIASLQDEMTGVSLAGTQLRVNQYNMHDTEWNDVKVSEKKCLDFIAKFLIGKSRQLQINDLF